MSWLDELMESPQGDERSVVDLDFSPKFAKAVEEKQIAEQRAKRAVYIAPEAEQEAQADINRATGKAEAQRSTWSRSLLSIGSPLKRFQALAG